MASEASGAGAVRIRDATPEDMEYVHCLIHDLAKYEGVPDGPQLSVQDLIQDGFQSSPAWFFCLIAEMDGKIVGYALCNRAYSSWTRRAYYIEDLYVKPDMRGKGIGKQLLARLCQMGVKEGVHRIDWHVLESNTSALAFYRGIGARCLRETEGRAALRLDGPHIERLAERDVY